MFFCFWCSVQFGPIRKLTPDVMSYDITIITEAFVFNAFQIITSLLGLILSLIAVVNEMFN